MRKFQYIIGANIVLDVTAEYQKAEPENDFDGCYEIVEVTCKGEDVEIDDIQIDCMPLRILIEQAAADQ